MTKSYSKSSLTRNMLILSTLGTLFSVQMIDVTWSKIIELRRAGAYVSPIRYGKVILSLMALGYVIWIGLQYLRLLSREKKQQKVA